MHCSRPRSGLLFVVFLDAVSGAAWSETGATRATCSKSSRCMASVNEEEVALLQAGARRLQDWKNYLEDDHNAGGMQAENTGTWHCSIDDQTPSFSAVKTFDLRKQHKGVRQELQKAQMHGYPVLLRHGDLAPEGQLLKTPNFAQLLRQHKKNLTNWNVKRFDPLKFTWAGMVTAKNGQMASLARQLSGSTGYGELDGDGDYKISTSLMSLVEAVRNNTTNGYYFHVQMRGPDMEHWDPIVKNLRIDDRYPLFTEDRLDYNILFVQPPGLGGAHIDDSVGATYFYLHLLEGEKVIRIWPFHEHGELQSWGCAQRHWDSNSTPELFIRGSYSKGFSTEHWTAHGFTYGLLNSDTYEYFSGKEMCRDLEADTSAQNLHWGDCFVEVTLKPGDEIFVPSGLPHQVTTTEPSVALSGNYQFSAVAPDIDLDQLRDVFGMTGMKSHRDKNGRSDILHVREKILKSDDFNLTKWKAYYNKNVLPSWLAVPMQPKRVASSSDGWALVTEVLLDVMQRGNQTYPM